jgi:hypothetical protein
VQDCVRSPRRSAGAAGEAGGDEGQRGEKVGSLPYVERWKKPSTRRSVGTGRNGDAWIGYFEIPWTGMLGRTVDAEEKACEESSNGDDDGVEAIRGWCCKHVKTANDKAGV